MLWKWGEIAIAHSVSELFDIVSRPKYSLKLCKGQNSTLGRCILASMELQKWVLFVALLPALDLIYTTHKRTMDLVEIYKLKSDCNTVVLRKIACYKIPFDDYCEQNGPHMGNWVILYTRKTFVSTNEFQSFVQGKSRPLRYWWRRIKLAVRKCRTVVCLLKTSFLLFPLIF